MAVRVLNKCQFFGSQSLTTILVLYMTDNSKENQ